MVILSLDKAYGEFVNCCYSFSLSLSLSFFEVHMSWILHVIATKEDNIHQKKCKEIQSQAVSTNCTNLILLCWNFCFYMITLIHNICISLHNRDSFI